jgi:hypothetical protein
MISPARLELIHLLVRAAVERNLPNRAIKNRINGFTRDLEEQREAVDYLTLLRTQRGDDLNLFTDTSNVRDDFVRPERLVAPSRALQEPPTTAAPGKRPGPKPLSREVVVASRQKLEVAGKPSGERSIAADLGSSRDAVRYALGKDRPKPRS